MPANLDQCVKKVMATGKSKSSAFAICNAALEKDDARAVGGKRYQRSAGLTLPVFICYTPKVESQHKIIFVIVSKPKGECVLRTTYQFGAF